MKKMKTIFSALMFCAMFVTTFVACSDDDDEPVVTPAATSVAGVYNGDMTCSVMGSESVFEDMTFTVTAVSDAAVNISISSFGNPPMQVPAFTVTGVTVTGSDGAYTLAQTEFSGTTDAGKAYSGTIQGSFTDKTITLMFNLQYGAMPMPMICTFSAPQE